MRRHLVSIVLAVCVAGLSISALVSSAQMPAKKHAPAAKPSVARYLVISPHTAEECVKSMDEMNAAKVLNKFDFGCKDGDHTAYAIVTAASAEQALMMVPADLRAKARAVKISKFTPAELKEMHEKMKM